LVEATAAFMRGLRRAPFSLTERLPVCASNPTAPRARTFQFCRHGENTNPHAELKGAAALKNSSRQVARVRWPGTGPDSRPQTAAACGTGRGSSQRCDRGLKRLCGSQHIVESALTNAGWKHRPKHTVIVLRPARGKSWRWRPLPGFDSNVPHPQPNTEPNRVIST